MNLSIDDAVRAMAARGGHFRLGSADIAELPEGMTVNGDLVLQGTDEPEPVAGTDMFRAMPMDLPEGLKVRGSLSLRGSGDWSLPKGLEVGGDLDLAGAQVAPLPEGLKVGGSLRLTGSSVSSLRADLSVGGDLDLRGSFISKLPDGLTVGRNLDLRETGIAELPDSLKVGGYTISDHPVPKKPAPEGKPVFLRQVPLELFRETDAGLVIAIPGAGINGADLAVPVDGEETRLFQSAGSLGERLPGFFNVRFPAGSEVEGVSLDGSGKPVLASLPAEALAGIWKEKHAFAFVCGPVEELAAVLPERTRPEGPFVFLRQVPLDQPRPGLYDAAPVPGAGPDGADLHVLPHSGEARLFPACDLDGRFLPGRYNIRFPAGSDAECYYLDKSGEPVYTTVPAEEVAEALERHVEALSRTAPGKGGSVADRRAAQAVAAMGESACGVAAPDGTDDPEYGG